ncbi:MAG: hypothetical protein ACRC9V_14965, partial [Aeromonas sp.]
MDVGIIDDLTVPILLVRNYPGFDQLLAVSFRTTDRSLGNVNKQEGECSDPNLFSELFQLVTGGGSFGKEQ